jgi:hypothetical protein
VDINFRCVSLRCQSRMQVPVNRFLTNLCQEAQATCSVHTIPHIGLARFTCEEVNHVPLIKDTGLNHLPVGYYAIEDESMHHEYTNFHSVFNSLLFFSLFVIDKIGDHENRN